MTTNATDVAAHLEQVYSVSGMKLQKLLYYAQAQALVQRGEVLFPEMLQAWRLGPVVRTVWEGRRGEPHLSAEDAALVRNVVQTYGRLSAEELSELSHRDEPWRVARAGLPGGANSERSIAPQDMQTFYLGRRLARDAAGCWRHEAPTEEEWCAARAALVAHRRARRGRMPTEDRAAFIRDQVVATQRLEGITVSPDLLVHG